ncbi:MAG: helix-turn-helix protein [Thermomicrobiales bacterium]|jgi:transcriptional regulator with XRE-family HTH domain|nr:helix-turn-helix protein [Thermomicrobiales bacterium]
MTSGIKRDPSGPFGVLLADLLDKRGVSYSQLADRAGIDRTMVTRMMIGERVPSVQTVRRIAKAIDAGFMRSLALYEAAAETAAQRSETP